MPWLSAGAALLVIVVLALPFFSLRLGSADQGTDPAGTPTRVAFDMLSKGFGPGFNGPLMLVGVVQPDQHAVIDAVAQDVSQQPDVARVAEPVYIPSKTGSGDVVLLNVYPDSAPQDGATTDLVNHLRGDTIPQAVGHSGVKILVGGTTAIFIDFSNVLSSKLPLFIGLVVVLSFLLLMTVFRSFVIPLTAACMNLLSIGAAFGILVAVFQWGDLGSLIGLDGTSPVEAFLPVMLFAILFGLSMDYQVFLVSPDPRGVHQVGRGQQGRRAQRPGRHGQDDHGRRADHDPRVRLLHPRRPARDQGVRHRPGRRHPRRRHLHPHGDRALAHDALRQGELVVPTLARPGAAQARRRRRRPGDATRCRRDPKRSPSWPGRRRRRRTGPPRHFLHLPQPDRSRTPVSTAPRTFGPGGARAGPA